MSQPTARASATLGTPLAPWRPGPAMWPTPCATWSPGACRCLTAASGSL